MTRFSVSLQRLVDKVVHHGRGDASDEEPIWSSVHHATDPALANYLTARVDLPNRGIIVPQTIYTCHLRDSASFEPLHAITFQSVGPYEGFATKVHSLPGLKLSDGTGEILHPHRFYSGSAWILPDPWQIVVQWPGHEPFRRDVRPKPDLWNPNMMFLDHLAVSICSMMREWWETLVEAGQEDEDVANFMARTRIVELRHVAKGTWQPVFAQSHRVEAQAQPLDGANVA